MKDAFIFDLDPNKPAPKVVFGVKRYKKEPWDGGWSGLYEYRLKLNREGLIERIKRVLRM